MGIRFEIIFEENANGTFFTGQVVKGRAIIHVDQEIPIKGIQLRVRGNARVRWEEDNTDGKSSDTLFDEEKYFDTVTECIDTKGHEQILNSGTHVFNFECALPSECPSSFEGRYGRIRYDTKIIIIRPMVFNKSYSMGFSVLKVFDLNQYPELRIPAKMEEFKNFCCGPCKSRPLVLSLELQKTSYVPGEFIEFKTKFVNNSSTKVEQLYVILNLVAFYSVRHRINTKTEKIAIAKKKYGAFEKDIFEVKENLQVPPTPPTCVGLCPIIKISYEVAVTAKVKGAHINPIVTIPVIIGNIPYVEQSANLSEKNLIANLTKGVTPVPCIDAEIPPPSYEEATYVQNIPTAPPNPKDITTQTDKTKEKFTPRYAFYSIDSEHSIGNKK